MIGLYLYKIIITVGTTHASSKIKIAPTISSFVSPSTSISLFIKAEFPLKKYEIKYEFYD